MVAAPCIHLRIIGPSVLRRAKQCVKHARTRDSLDAFPAEGSLYRLTIIAALAVMLAACSGRSKNEARPSATAISDESHSADDARVDAEMFSLGVASGDVTSSSAVLWTRAERADGVTAEVATSESFDSAMTADADTPEDGDFAAKVRVDGLEPGTRYYYRFRAGESLSETGTFETAPAADVSAPVRFVFSGDSDGARQEGGTPMFNNFEALDRAAEEDPDFFLYFGDTIYGDRAPEAKDVEGYRGKYRQNREYPALAGILRATSTYNTWDDHEVENDFAGETEDESRVEAGLQAFHEYMPIDDGGDDASKMYRTFRWGKDVELFVLDERRYRSGEAKDACESDGRPDPLPGVAAPSVPEQYRSGRALLGLTSDVPEGCLDALNDASRTMLGAEQEQWLKDELAASDATWKVIVNEVPVQQIFADPYDRWEGYAAERREVLSYVRDEGIKNVVFLTTDLHGNVFGPVKIDIFGDPAPVAYEAVTGPIATYSVYKELSANLGQRAADLFGPLLLSVVGVDCAQLDSFSYSLVDVDPAARTMTITAKDDSGAVLCKKALQAE